MPENKTQTTKMSVLEFIQTIELKQRHVDALELLAIFAEVTIHEAVLWGSSIIGYGSFSYQTADTKTHQFKLNKDKWDFM